MNGSEQGRKRRILMLTTLRTEAVLLGGRGVVESPGGQVWLLRERGKLLTVQRRDVTRGRRSQPEAKTRLSAEDGGKDVGGVEEEDKRGAEKDWKDEVVVEDGQGARWMGGSRNGERVFVADESGHVRCYDGMSRELIRSVEVHPEGGTACLATSRNVVATAGRIDRTIRIFDSWTGRILQSVSIRDRLAEDDEVTAMCICPGRIFVGSSYGKLVSVSASASHDVLDLQAEIRSICKLPTSSSRLWLGMATGHVMVIHRRRVVFSSKAHGGPVHSLCPASRALVCSAASDARVCVWDATRSPPKLLHSACAWGSEAMLTTGATNLIECNSVWIAAKGAVRKWTFSSSSKDVQVAQLLQTLSAARKPSVQETQRKDQQNDVGNDLDLGQQLKKDEEIRRLGSKLEALEAENEQLRAQLRRKDAELSSARISSRRQRRGRFQLPASSDRGADGARQVGDRRTEDGDDPNEGSDVLSGIDEDGGLVNSGSRSSAWSSRRALLSYVSSTMRGAIARSTYPRATLIFPATNTEDDAEERPDNEGGRPQDYLEPSPEDEEKFRKELSAALQLIREMDDASRRSDARLERLTALLSQRSQSLAEQKRDLDRANLTIAECRDCMLYAQSELETVLTYARQIMDAKRTEGGLHRARSGIVGP